MNEDEVITITLDLKLAEWIQLMAAAKVGAMTIKQNPQTASMGDETIATVDGIMRWICLKLREIEDDEAAHASPDPAQKSRSEAWSWADITANPSEAK